MGLLASLVFGSYCLKSIRDMIGWRSCQSTSNTEIQELNLTLLSYEVRLRVEKLKTRVRLLETVIKDQESDLKEMWESVLAPTRRLPRP